MDKNQFQAIFAGICFGLYPLLLNKCRVNGNIMVAVFSLGVALFIIPFALSQVKNLANTDWRMLIGASMISAVGMMFMTRFLSGNSQASIGLLIILMVVTQALVTAIYQICMDGSASITRVLGFGCAIVSIVLLNKK